LNLSKSSSSPSEHKTGVWYGGENIIDKSLEVMYTIEKYYDLSIAKDGLKAILSDDRIRNAYHDLKRRGVIIRIVTEITKDNLNDYKALSGIGEIRHLSEMSGNFVIADKKSYAATSDLNDTFPLITELIYSTVPAFVKQQQRFFDMLWKKAIPSKQRIKEIEEGMKREFIETIQDPSETKDLIHKTISSATEEIMIMIPTVRSFQVHEREGVFNLIKRQLENRITVRILLSRKDSPTQRVWQDISTYPNLQIQYTNQLPSNRLTMVIVDNELSLVIEEKKYEDPVGIATYSNSESTVLSYASIFENLWIQSEIQQQ
jgi:sugar-specific transcriptional regulator TrmB